MVISLKHLKFNFFTMKLHSLKEALFILIMITINNIHNLLNDIFGKHLSNIYKNNKIIKSKISGDKLVYYKYSQKEKTK